MLSSDHSAEMVSLAENRKCWIIHGNAGKPTPLQELNPLLFPTVLNRIFSYLSVWNQKKCRSVCKTWAAELSPTLRLNCKVNLTKLVTSLADDNGTQDIDHTHIKLLQGISQICHSFVIEEDPIIIHILQTQTATSLPLLTIKYLEIKNFQWEPSHVKRILRELPHLEELRLPILCSVSDKENTSPPINSRSNPINSTKLSHHHTNKYISKSGNTLSNWKSKNFSQNPCQTQESFCKLKRIIVTLTIRDLQFLDYKSAPIQPILDLIHLTPNLEEVYYPNIVQFTSPFDNPARVLLENIISSQSLCRLSTLKIDTFLTNADLRLLTAKGHAFKSLQLTLTPAIGVKYLYEFLQGSNSSLKSLTLTLRDGFKFTTAFPTLSPALERMSLILWKGHFDFIPEIQKLKVLIIVLIEMEEEHFQKLKDFSSSKLEELEIHGNQRSKIDLAQVILTQIRGPCLIKLTLDWVDDSLLQIIFRMLPNLQELGILYGGFTQAGITGIGEKYCDKDGEIMAKRGLGIGDLKRLRALTLTGDLTNGLLDLGVGQCESLQQLELTARSSSKVGDAGVKALADGRLNCTLQFLRLKNFLDLISPEAVTYLRNKFNGREIHIC